MRRRRPPLASTRPFQKWTASAPTAAQRSSQRAGIAPRDQHADPRGRRGARAAARSTPSSNDENRIVGPSPRDSSAASASASMPAYGPRAAALDLEVERDPRAERVEHLVERRNALAAAGVERADLRERALARSRHRRPGRRSSLVVRDHDRAVARAVQVDLDHVGALLDRERVGGQRVLGTFARRAAVRDHERAPRLTRRAQPRERSTARRQPA